MVTSYDLLDRATRTAQFGLSAADVRYSHTCYDLAGDVVATVKPAANAATVDCAALGTVNYVTRYTFDAAHRMLTKTDPLGRKSVTAYDANGRTTISSTDIDRAVARVQKTTMTYDQRGLTTRQVEVFDKATNRDLTTVTVYDQEGRETAGCLTTRVRRGCGGGHVQQVRDAEVLRRQGPDDPDGAADRRCGGQAVRARVVRQARPHACGRPCPRRSPTRPW